MKYHHTAPLAIAASLFLDVPLPAAPIAHSELKRSDSVGLLANSTVAESHSIDIAGSYPKAAQAIEALSALQLALINDEDGKIRRVPAPLLVDRICRAFILDLQSRAAISAEEFDATARITNNAEKLYDTTCFLLARQNLVLQIRDLPLTIDDGAGTKRKFTSLSVGLFKISEEPQAIDLAKWRSQLKIDEGFKIQVFAVSAADLKTEIVAPFNPSLIRSKESASFYISPESIANEAAARSMPNEQVRDEQLVKLLSDIRISQILSAPHAMDNLRLHGITRGSLEGMHRDMALLLIQKELTPQLLVRMFAAEGEGGEHTRKLVRSVVSKKSGFEVVPDERSGLKKESIRLTAEEVNACRSEILAAFDNLFESIAEPPQLPDPLTI